MNLRIYFYISFSDLMILGLCTGVLCSVGQWIYHFLSLFFFFFLMFLCYIYYGE